MNGYVKKNSIPAPRANELWVVDIKGRRGTMFVLRVFPSADGVHMATAYLNGFLDEAPALMLVARGQWTSSHGPMKLIRRIRLTLRGKDRGRHADEV